MPGNDGLFRRLLRELRPVFQQEGFRRSSQNFVLETDECWVIFNFQKSRWSQPGVTDFYINVAASTKRWVGTLGKPATTAPHYSECDWRWRIEQFGPDKDVGHWAIRDGDTLERTIAYLRELLTEFVLPATRTMRTEVDLLKHTGEFQYAQLKTRTVILAARNESAALKEAVCRLIDKSAGSVGATGVLEHVRFLHSTFPEVMREIEAESSAAQ